MNILLNGERTEEVAEFSCIGTKFTEDEQSKSGV